MNAPAPPTGVRIGCVPYLNARPLVHGIEDRCVFAHPSALARDLFSGRLDVALVPVAEWFNHPECERVGGFGIACDGPVFSVVLAGMAAPGLVGEVFLDDASRTSAALARILLADCPPDKWTPVEPARIAGIVPVPGQASLLIGDQAIRFRENHPDVPVLDLGQAWKTLTGLPFVFALWVRRPDCPEPEALAAALDAAAQGGIKAAAQLPLGAFEHYYLNEAIRFPIGARCLDGLDAFRVALAHRMPSPAGRVFAREKTS